MASQQLVRGVQDHALRLASRSDFGQSVHPHFETKQRNFAKDRHRMDLLVQDRRGERSSVLIDKNPDTCPICIHGIEPVELAPALFTNTNWEGKKVERPLVCPREQCQHMFIARYYERLHAAIYCLRECVPAELPDVAFTDEVLRISPDFCDIYNEAHKAEQQGFTLVCGPGYRKSLEFLIKDYVSGVHPEQKKEIAEMRLGPCITKYVSSEKVKSTAARAAWLGNDETHYVRKWEDKDLQDLKKLITLTSHWIQDEELTKDAVTDMPVGKK
jgi:hypothetical protein